MPAPIVIGSLARKFASSFAKNAMGQVSKSGSRNQKAEPKLILDKKSLALTLKVMEKDFEGVKAGARKGVKAAAVILMDLVKENMSSTAHTKRDLQRLDHPYADRHGRVRTTSLGGMKPYEIHDQDGTMINSLFVKNSGNKAGSYSTVAFNGSIAPHAKYVVQGTRTMLPRNVIMGTAEEADSQEKMAKAVVKEISKVAGVSKLGAVWQFV